MWLLNNTTHACCHPYQCGRQFSRVARVVAESHAGIPPARDHHQRDSEAAASETLLGDWGGLRTRWSDRGFNVTVQYIAEVAGNVTGGVDQGAVYNGLLNLAGDVDFDKLAGWRGAKFHAAMLYPHGKSLTDKYVNDLFVLSNLDASDDVHLFELWLEQKFSRRNILRAPRPDSARSGNLSIRSKARFLTTAPSDGFPSSARAPCIRKAHPASESSGRPVSKSIFKLPLWMACESTDAAGNETNPHGVKFRFDEGALIFAETGFNWALAHDTKPGSLKLGGWYHTADTASVRFDDTGLSLADPLTSGNPATLGDNWGLYLGAEQVLWKKLRKTKHQPKGWGVFGRLGYAPADRNLLGFYAEAGVTRTGLVRGGTMMFAGWPRPMARSARFPRAGDRRQFFSMPPEPSCPDYEMVIECEYQWNVRRLRHPARHAIHRSPRRFERD